jgi:hypothetical protein
MHRGTASPCAARGACLSHASCVVVPLHFLCTVPLPGDPKPNFGLPLGWPGTDTSKTLYQPLAGIMLHLPSKEGSQCCEQPTVWRTTLLFEGYECTACTLLSAISFAGGATVCLMERPMPSWRAHVNIVHPCSALFSLSSIYITGTQSATGLPPSTSRLSP